SLGGFRHVTQRVAYSRDGRRLAAASLDGTVRIWELGTNRPPTVLTARAGSLRDVAWSPDNKHLAAGGWHETVGGEVSTGKLVRRLHQGAHNGMRVSWHPGSKLLATAAGDVCLWEWPSGKLLRKLSRPTEATDPDPHAIAFDPDGHILAVATEGTVYL